MDGMRLRPVLISVLLPLLVIAAAIVGGRSAGGEVAADTRSAMTSALDSLPADTQVVGITDWSRIRRVLGVGAAKTASDRATLTDDASLRDLSTRSVIGQYTEEMHDAYGWSPADLDWEAYGQAKDGSVMVARLDDSVSFGSVRSHLGKLGYSRDGRVWTPGPDSTASQELTSTLAAVTLVPRQRLVVAADRATYASTVLETIDRDAPSLLSVRSAADVASTLVGADSALLQSGPFTCQSTSLEDAGADVQAQARAALDRAGALVKPEFTGRALDAGSKTSETMRFALGFRSPTAAARQLQVRTALASGPFIGRSGRLEESLVLRSSAVRGSTALLRFRHNPDSTAYMTGDGPLLFASCPL
jgi:hypothetical protein